MIGVSAGPASGFTVMIVLLLLLVIVVWFVTATAASLKGNNVEPVNRIAQMYGYTVCLICVIVVLTSLSSVVDAAFDRAHPLQTQYGFGVSLASFDAFKATYSRERLGYPNQTPDTASEATLRARYRGLLEERKASTLYTTAKQFTTSGIMGAVAIILFVVHWRWLRRQRGLASTAG